MRPPVLWNADSLSVAGARDVRQPRWRASSFAGSAFALVLLVCTSSAALFLTRLAPGDVTSQLGAFAPRAEIEATRSPLRSRSQSGRAVGTMGVARGAARLRRLVSLQPSGRAARRAGGRQHGGPGRRRPGRSPRSSGSVSASSPAAGGPDGCSALVRGASVMFISVPPLLMSLMLVFIAARTRWLPTSGMLSAGAVDPSWPTWIADVAWHLRAARAGAGAADCRDLRAAAVAVDVGGRAPAVSDRRDRPWRVQTRSRLASRLAGVDASDLRRVRAGRSARCSPGRSSSSSSRRGRASAG